MSNIINNKYILINKLGEGSFGSIYKGQNIRTKEYVAIKVETIQSANKLLKNESIIYNYLNKCNGMPNVRWFGKDETNYYMVIDLLGQTIQQLKDTYKTIPLKIVLQIGIKIVNLLNIIHDKGLIHRDIKPENFLFGLNTKKNDIFIIDFGFSKVYINNDAHIEMKRTHNIIGSNIYVSLNGHNYMELSRRDDMESLGYMLIYLYLGELPWNNATEPNLNEKIKQMKLKILNDESIPGVLIDYLEYVRSLEFTDTPNYSSIVEKFMNHIS